MAHGAVSDAPIPVAVFVNVSQILGFNVPMTTSESHIFNQVGVI